MTRGCGAGQGLRPPRDPAGDGRRPVKFELRLATPRDAPEVVDLQIAVWRAAFLPLLPAGFEIPPREQFLIMGERALGEPGVKRTVAELNGRLVGFSTHGPSRDAG